MQRRSLRQGRGNAPGFADFKFRDGACNENVGPRRQFYVGNIAPIA
jgi:hypothetical protein